MKEDTCIIYMIRHGATDNNLADPPRLQGRRENPGLSEEGRRQAEQTADFLSQYPIASVYSSPLRRAVETAQPIAARHVRPVEIVDQITEVDLGDWDGRDWNEIQTKDAEAYRSYMDDPDTHTYPGGESFAQVIQRVTPAMERLAEDNLGGQIAVTAHNIVIRMYLGHLLGLAPKEARWLSQSNCGLNVLRYRKGRMKLRTVNAVFHLGNDLE